ncbi:hypothetical protein [Mesorhizobium sp. M1399]|uniref:lipopolysaccharide biosynthesis protein n=1 Tax=Mesorhizobium sp. M1399 TaxID=2957096 RepID=UPI003336F5A7
MNEDSGMNHSLAINLSKRIDILGSVLLQYAATALSFVSVLALAKILDVAAYGAFMYGLALAALTQVITNAGNDRVLLPEIRRTASQYEAFRHIRSIVSIQIASYISLTAMFVAFVWMRGASNQLYVFCGLVWGGMVGLDQRIVFDYIGKIRVHSTFVAAERFFTFSVIILCLYLGEAGMWLLYALSASRGLFTLIQYGYLSSFSRRAALPVFSQVRGGDRASAVMMRVVYTIIALLSSALIWGQIFLIEHSGDIKAVAYFGILLQLSASVQVAQAQLLRYYNVRIFLAASSEGSNFKLGPALLKATLISAVLTVLFVLLSAMVENYVVNGYNQLTRYAVLLGPWLIFLGPASFVSQVFASRERPLVHLIVVLTSMLISFFLTWLSVPFFGLAGAILGLSIGHMFSVGMQFALLRYFGRVFGTRRGS